MAYQIKINNFEGPFDLLFHLIEKAEVDIYDIPIAEITNQYLEYIYQMESLDLDVASEFVLMAATLIQIKSKMLLPNEPSPLDEIAVAIDDPRAELIEKLLEYKRYKEASAQLKVMEEKYINVFYKHAEIIDDIEEENILKDISLDDILRAFKDVIDRFTSSQNIDNLERQILPEEYTVDDKMNDIREYMNINKKVLFSDLLTMSIDRLEAIITFLALLEMIRLREIIVYQTKVYGEIILEGV
jgi:segregation and condensation protein A